MNKPIGVYTLWRSGSTAYCQHISKELNILNFDEMFFNNVAEDRRPLSIANIIPTTPQLLNLIDNKFIFKLMPDQLDAPGNVEWRILERRDVETQLLSYCYAHYTNMWFEKADQVVTLPMDSAGYFIKYYHKFKRMKRLTEWPVVYYEDLKLDKSDLQATNNDYKSLILNYKDIISLL